jgi:branched-chain amino acid transport system substrate-binding protein
MKKVRFLGFAFVIVALVLSSCSGATPTTVPSVPTAEAPTAVSQATVPPSAEAPTAVSQATVPPSAEAPTTAAQATTAPTSASAANKDPIKIGLFLPMTGSVAFIGQGYKLGIDLAIKDLGGAIDGHPLQTFVADNKGTPTDSVNAVHLLLDVNQVQVMIGGAASSATMAGMPIIGEGQTPTIDGSSTNPTIYNQLGVGGNKWLFRIGPDDLIMGQGFAEYIAQHVKSISFVGDDNQFGHGAGQVYVPLLPKDGVKILSEDYFDPATTDYRPGLTKIKSAGADAVLIVMTDQSCATFMRQLREVGLTQQIFSRGSCTTGLFNQLTKDDPKIGEGITEFSFFTQGNDPDLSKHFQDTYNQPITSHRMAGYYAMYYTIAPAIKAVIAAGKDLTRANIRDAIATVNVDTPNGTLKFDDHNQNYPQGALTTNKDLQTVLISTLDLKPVDHTGF